MIKKNLTNKSVACLIMSAIFILDASTAVNADPAKKNKNKITSPEDQYARDKVGEPEVTPELLSAARESAQIAVKLRDNNPNQKMYKKNADQKLTQLKKAYQDHDQYQIEYDNAGFEGSQKLYLKSQVGKPPVSREEIYRLEASAAEAKEIAQGNREDKNALEKALSLNEQVMSAHKKSGLYQDKIRDALLEHALRVEDHRKSLEEKAGKTVRSAEISDYNSDFVKKNPEYLKHLSLYEEHFMKFKRALKNKEQLKQMAAEHQEK